MIREIIYALTFDKNWIALGLTDEDLAHLESALIEHPDSGKVIEGTGGLRKLRFALPNRGKSGGARILYVDFAYYEKLFMFNIYAKGNKDSLTSGEKPLLGKQLRRSKTPSERNERHGKQCYF